MQLYRRLYFIILLLAGFLTAQAQLAKNQRLLGYTLTDDIDVSGGAFGYAGTYTIGAVLTPQMLSPYEGCRVVGLRLAAALPLGRTRTFIYTVENSDLQPVIEQRQRIYEGWNTVMFNGDGYEIKGGEMLFFGFDYTETDEMVQADEGGLCGVGEDTDGAFYAYGNFGSGVGLYSLSGLGCLCVQLIVDVSSLPGFDLDMTYLDTGFKHKQPGEIIEAYTTCRNTGTDTIFSYRLGYQLDSQEPVFATFTDTILSGRQAVWQFRCSLPSDIAIGMHQLSVFASEAGGQPLPERSKNDTLTAQFAVYRESMERQQAYLEIYTDQTSAYVPWLDDAVDLLAGKFDRMAVVNVHRPGTPLALTEAAYLHQLYAYDWPTFTVNRSYFPGEAYIAYDMNDFLPVIPAEMSAGILGDVVMQDAASPAFASVQLQASYDAATRQLTISSEGEALPEATAIYGDLALTLLLTEDGVVSRQAQYNAATQRTTNNQNYVHDYVLRGFMTSPTGDAIQVEDGRFSATHTTTLDAAWKPERMRVVALLTKKADQVTDDNVLDMDVLNANSLSLAQELLAVRTPIQDVRGVPAGYYTLDGKPLGTAKPRPGIYLRRMADGTMRKQMIK